MPKKTATKSNTPNVAPIAAPAALDPDDEEAVLDPDDEEGAEVGANVGARARWGMAVTATLEAVTLRPVISVPFSCATTLNNVAKREGVEPAESVVTALLATISEPRTSKSTLTAVEEELERRLREAMYVM